MEIDNNGYIYVSSRGDYYNVPSKTFVIDSSTDKVIGEIDNLANSEMALCGDSLYVYSTEWSYYTNSWTITYAIYNTEQKQIQTRNFITDGTEKEIEIPYGVAINPETGEFFVTDAKNYVTPGKLHCYSKDGVRKWSVTTGDIPAHFAFTRKKLRALK